MLFLETRGHCGREPNTSDPSTVLSTNAVHVPTYADVRDFCDVTHRRTMSRWEQLLSFANSTGLQLVFGLNGCRGRKSATSAMDMSNIHNFLNWTVTHGYCTHFISFYLPIFLSSFHSFFLGGLQNYFCTRQKYFQTSSTPFSAVCCILTTFPIYVGWCAQQLL